MNDQPEDDGLEIHVEITGEGSVVFDEDAWWWGDPKTSAQEGYERATEAVAAAEGLLRDHNRERTEYVLELADRLMPFVAGEALRLAMQHADMTVDEASDLWVAAGWPKPRTWADLL